MNAFRPSEEKAAAVAPVILSGTLVVLPQVPVPAPVQVKIYTWFGVSTVSERTATVPLGETARTLPTAEGERVVVPPAGFSTITPFVPSSPRSVPRKARAPFGSKTREFGVAGKLVVEETP